MSPVSCHDRKFSTKLTMRRHMGIHQGDKPFECPHCHYSTRLKASLVQHLRVHTGNVFRPYSIILAGTVVRTKTHTHWCYSLHCCTSMFYLCSKAHITVCVTCGKCVRFGVLHLYCKETSPE